MEYERSGRCQSDRLYAGGAGAQKTTTPLADPILRCLADGGGSGWSHEGVAVTSGSTVVGRPSVPSRFGRSAG